jgi:hypothetical protein
MVCAFGSQPQVALIRTPDGGIQPQAALDDRGGVHLIYFKGDPAGGDVFYVNKAPGEGNFSQALLVNTQPGSVIALGTIRGAQLALGRNGRVHVAWNGHAPKNGSYKEAPMLYTHLNDAGTAFEPERNVITIAGGLDGGGSVAADQAGNVLVMWHAPAPGDTNGEAGREVFMARSVDDGKTFAPEKAVSGPHSGACGCCGMKAFANKQGDVLALYRGASEMANRDEIVLMSRNQGADFQTVYQHHWAISSCPMSSASLSETADEVLAAAETHGRVFYVRINPKTGQVSEPVSPDAKGQHPVVIANSRGEVLLVWTEGTTWGKGGRVAWQLYRQDGKPISGSGHAEGLPAWSLAAAFTQPSGDFVIVF